MDFIVQLPKTKQRYDSIFVVVDQLSKWAHFIPTYTNAIASQIAQLFFKHIFVHYGLPQVIVSDRNPKFTSQFWRTLFKNLETKLAMFSAHHPQTDRQTERINQTLKKMI